MNRADDIVDEGERFIAEYMSKILDAAIVGDFKTVKHYAKKIRQQAISDKISISN